LAIRFFEKLLHVATHADDSKLSPGLDKFRLRRVLEFIEDNLDHELSLKALSDVAALQVNHFARAFKQATHLPPHRYVLLRRLARAKELLSHTDESIAYIAYAVGFSSQAHFTAAFSRLAGMTPNVYRIEHRYRKHFFRLPAR
jgi:AraC family transcriptional regulator